LPPAFFNALSLKLYLPMGSIFFSPHTSETALLLVYLVFDVKRLPLLDTSA